MSRLPRLPRARLLAGTALALVLGAAACTFVQTRSGVPLGSSAPAPSTKVAVGAPGVALQPAPVPPASAPAQTDALARSSANASTSAGAGASAAQAPAPADASGSAQAQAQAQTSTPSIDRMVIRTAQLSVEVPTSPTAMEQALNSVRQIAQQGGGYVSASNTHVERVDDGSGSSSSDTQTRTVADLTLQVRADAADETLSALRALGSVTAETSGSQDVTDDYVDISANLRNLQASETAIVKLMDKATRIEDILSLQRELTNVRGQIERIQGRKQYLEHRSDMATISVSLRPAAAASSTPTTSGWNPLQIAQRGWQASLTVLRSVAEVLIVVVAFSWWLVPLAGLGLYIWQRRRPRPTTPASAPVP